MATASSELDVIDSNPVKKALGTFQRLFESTRADLGVADSSDAVQVVFSTATVGMAQIIVVTFLANIRSCKKLVARPHPHSAKRNNVRPL
jgi:hypothetical protein